MLSPFSSRRDKLLRAQRKIRTGKHAVSDLEKKQLCRRSPKHPSGDYAEARGKHGYGF
jgi:hypothetical protein